MERLLLQQLPKVLNVEQLLEAGRRPYYVGEKDFDFVCQRPLVMKRLRTIANLKSMKQAKELIVAVNASCNFKI